MEQGAMRNALENFIGTVEATGGVCLDEEGHYVPVADPEWMDLGGAYLVACAALHRQPMIVAQNGHEDVEDDGDRRPRKQPRPENGSTAL
jgi:hypothetical protein